jgi:hypothetical protein
MFHALLLIRSVADWINRVDSCGGSIKFATTVGEPEAPDMDSVGGAGRLGSATDRILEHGQRVIAERHGWRLFPPETCSRGVTLERACGQDTSRREGAGLVAPAPASAGGAYSPAQASV